MLYELNRDMSTGINSGKKDGVGIAEAHLVSMLNYASSYTSHLQLE